MKRNYKMNKISFSSDIGKLTKQDLYKVSKIFSGGEGDSLFLIGLDWDFADKLREEKLDSNFVLHIQELGRELLKKKYKCFLSPSGAPYDFFENSCLLRKIDTLYDSGSLCLEIDFLNFYSGDSKLRRKEKVQFDASPYGLESFSGVFYSPHNSEIKAQALCLVELFEIWINSATEFF